ncbi:hypothetical protein HPB49_009176 [Dermacentor silvarum]|uniref:Uncharacterized protein n=1 Tax=Dermacentor silvarum TaxID=543639 RepID=A0ACB8D456_DERSI|nr:hypothetical protein HPB49_009176 [Dermacentor silvarum]
MKAEGKLNEQPISLMFPGQPSSMLTPPCGGIHQATSASFQPWLEAPPLQPVVRQAQVPCAALAGVQVTLENSDLWTKFYAIGNEMIITRPGRRMFPVMQVRVSGMEHSSYYMLLLDLVPMDNFRYRFLGNCWLPVEPATDSSPDDCVGGDGRPYLHENGPCLGSQWMMRPVNFGAVKLTNQKSNTAQKASDSQLHIYAQTHARKRSSDNNDVLWDILRTSTARHGHPIGMSRIRPADVPHTIMMLQSMRKYVPRVHVFAGSDVQQLDYRRFKTFVFPETGFISVTSYQNEQPNCEFRNVCAIDSADVVCYNDAVCRISVVCCLVVVYSVDACNFNVIAGKCVVSDANVFRLVAAIQYHVSVSAHQK